MKKPAGKTKAKVPAPRRAPAAARKTGAAAGAKPATKTADFVASLDPNFVEALAQIVARHDLSEVVVENEGLHIRVARQLQAVAVTQAAPVQNVSVAAAPTVAAPAATPLTAAGPAPDHPGTVKSPMVGTAYRRPSPDAKAFVEIGSSVKAGEKVMLVEAMKTFNEIVAPRAGTVTALFVDDGQPIEYGQPLLVIE